MSAPVALSCLLVSAPCFNPRHHVRVILPVLEELAELEGSLGGTV